MAWDCKQELPELQTEISSMECTHCRGDSPKWDSRLLSLGSSQCCSTLGVGFSPIWWCYFSQYETFYHRWGLEPSQNPDWDLNPCGWDSKPQYLVSGPNEAQVLDISLLKEFSERQSDRSEVYLCRYSENTPQTECGPSQRVNVALKWGMVSFFFFIYFY